MQFHWIFILIAGALILTFFFSIALKQQAISTQRLELTLKSELDNIFTQAIVSKGTAQRIPVPPQGLGFTCSDTCTCRFTIKGAGEDFGDRAIFAPGKISEQQMVVWSKELKMPYRITNLLYVTNPNIKYYFVHDNTQYSKELKRQFEKSIPPLINHKFITSMSSVIEEENAHTRFVLLDVNPETLDDSFKKASASAIKIDGGITFYEKNGVKLDYSDTVPYAGVPSLLAAIFSEDSQMYRCGMQTAFRKLKYVSRIYAERAQELQERAFTAEKIWCDYSVAIGYLNEQESAARILAVELDQTEIGILRSKKDLLEQENRQLLRQSCPEIF